LLIMKREYLSRVRKRSFIVMTLIGPLLFAGIMIVPIWLASRDGEERVIEVVDESGLFYEKFLETSSLKFQYINSSIDEAKQKVPNNQNYGLLHVPAINLEDPKGITFYSESNPGIELVQSIERTIKREIDDIRLQRSGINPDTLASLKTSVSINTINLTEFGEKKGHAGISTIVGYLSSILIYFFIFYYGAQVMRGVMEEKSSRIVEIIISSVKPFQLMMGKIVGVAGVGLTQFVLWVLLTFTISSIIFSVLHLDRFSDPGFTESLANLPESEAAQAEMVSEIFSALDTINIPLILVSFVFFFLGAYLLYAALFATVGSAVDSEADTQQFMLPIMIPLILSIVVLSAVIKEPDGSLAFWMSMIPFTSPVVMMMRVPFGVAGWELLLSMLLLIGGFILTTWFASRIYRIGILMHGSKVSYRVLAKWFLMK